MSTPALHFLIFTKSLALRLQFVGMGTGGVGSGGGVGDRVYIIVLTIKTDLIELKKTLIGRHNVSIYIACETYRRDRIHT